MTDKEVWEWLAQDWRMTVEEMFAKINADMQRGIDMNEKWEWIPNKGWKEQK